MTVIAHNKKTKVEMTDNSEKFDASDMVNYAVGIGYNYYFEYHGDEGESHTFCRDFEYCRTSIVVYTYEERRVRAYGVVYSNDKTLFYYHNREFDSFSPDIIKDMVRYFQEKNRELHLFVKNAVSTENKKHDN